MSPRVFPTPPTVVDQSLAIGNERKGRLERGERWLTGVAYCVRSPSCGLAYCVGYSAESALLVGIRSVRLWCMRGRGGRSEVLADKARMVHTKAMDVCEMK